MNDEEKKEELQVSDEDRAKVLALYGDDESEMKYAQQLIQQINDDLELREQPSIVFNGIAYSDSYEYNQRKAINYSPPRNLTDDRQISMGMVHEKILTFIAVFLKYVWKRDIDCYDEKGNLVVGLGDIYDLAIEHSYKQEELYKKIALFFWEVFTQGNAFILEDWEVKTTKEPTAYKNGEKVDPTKMDYTYEFLDDLEYPDDEYKTIQKRRAVSKLLDGRMVIFGDPEIEEVQDQPRITIESELSKADAEAIFGSLKRFNSAPKSKTEIDNIVGERTTLFDSKRLKKPEDVYLSHMTLDKENNRMNFFLNGIMLLSRKTPMTIFYPRNNYPLINMAAERLRGSIYARSVPAKTKFNADFVDWALKMLANKFEQGIDPAILTSGRYTLTRDMFRGGQVTHGVKREDFEKADPDNKGITQSEFSFVGMLKEIIETQTINPTSSGELDANATATAIATADARQVEKLGGLLDSLVFGFMDLALRRAETIESKYTLKQRETIVDGETVPVYQNFMVNVAGVQHSVVFDDNVGGETYDYETKRHELFKKSFDQKKKGVPTEYYLTNPRYLRENRSQLQITIKPEKIKDTQLLMIQMFDEFKQLLELFPNTDREVLQKEYLKISGRPDDLFKKQLQALEAPQGAGYNMGSFGKPTIKQAISKDKINV